MGGFPYPNYKELRTVNIIELKSELKVELKIELRTVNIIELKIELKVELKIELKVELRTVNLIELKKLSLNYGANNYPIREKNIAQEYVTYNFELLTTMMC